MQLLALDTSTETMSIAVQRTVDGQVRVWQHSAPHLVSRLRAVRHPAGTVDFVHCVTISGLSANTDCYWKVVSSGVESGDSNGSAFIGW